MVDVGVRLLVVMVSVVVVMEASTAQANTPSITPSVLSSSSNTDPVTDSTVDVTDDTQETTESLSTWGGVIEAEEDAPTLLPSTHQPPSTHEPPSIHLPQDNKPVVDAAVDKTIKPLDERLSEEEPLKETKEDIMADEMYSTEVPTTIIPKAQAYAPSSSLRVCPGVCVANRISEYCEAALDVNQLCRSGLRCCVSGDLFLDVDEPPKEFVLLNPKKSTEKTEDVREQERTSTERPTTITTSATTSRSTHLTTVYTRHTVPTTKPPRDIPQEIRCKGTCVAGFFAFLCDEIDRFGVCPRGGRCCVTQRRQPKPKPSTNSSEPVPTTTTKTTTSQPMLLPSTRPLPPC
ncbi:hypothetical protein OTU49_009673, partial [Cherax quadricarinatus]